MSDPDTSLDASASEPTDPERWTDALDRAPEGIDDVLSSIEGTPLFPPDVRARIRVELRRAPPPVTPAPRRWIGPTLTVSAVVTAGVIAWMLLPTKPNERAAIRPDVIDPVMETSLDDTALDDTALDDTALEDTALHDTALDDTALHDTALHDTALHDTALDRVAARPAAHAWVTGPGPPPDRRRPRNEPAPPDGARDATDRGRIEPTNIEPTPPGAPGAAQTGWLTINTMPWTRVFIDGRDTGRFTPVRRLPVPAGRHTVGLRTNDGFMHNVQVDIGAGESERIVRQLSTTRPTPRHVSPW